MNLAVEEDLSQVIWVGNYNASETKCDIAKPF